MRKDEVTWGALFKSLFALVSLFGGIAVMLFGAIQWLPVWLTALCLGFIWWGWRIAEGFTKENELKQKEEA